MMARSHIRPGFWLVFWREVGWLRRRPFLLGLTTIVPLAQMAFLAAIFSAGLATRLPIGVLDLDSSDLSRTIIRMDPEDLREVISAYQKCVTEAVHLFGGFVAKYMVFTRLAN